MSDRLMLIGGSYEARSLLANAQRCVNLFPEANQKDSPVPLTFYQRPGFVPLAFGPALPVRGLYEASNGNGYVVIGQGVYAVDPGWALTQLGSLSADLSTPVSMIDNRTTLFLVDNSTSGYQIDLTTNVMSPIVDTSGSFTGATRVDYCDTFMLWNEPGTNRFGSTLSNELVFDPLYFGAKVNYPDNLVSLLVNRREIWLIGSRKSEIWFDAGNAQFPFAELPGAAFEHGCEAPFSVASQDVATYWLARNLQGKGIVVKGGGYQLKRISTHAIENAIQGYPTISDAIGYTYQQNGHVFYVLTFPSGNATWVWDEASGLWHQRAWSDANGVLHRDRSNCAAWMHGKNVVGDWENGTIYHLDPGTYTDTVDGVTQALTCIRSFPHIVELTDSTGQFPIHRVADGKRVQFSDFQADIQCGDAPLDSAGQPARITLAWSDDRGRTYGNGVLQMAGAPGEYNTYPQWRGLGIARDRIFELSYSIAGPAALNGAWVDAKVLGT